MSQRGRGRSNDGRDVMFVIAVVTGVSTLVAFTFAPAVVAGLVGATGASSALIYALYHEHMAARDQRQRRPKNREGE